MAKRRKPKLFKFNFNIFVKPKKSRKKCKFGVAKKGKRKGQCLKQPRM